MNLKMYAYKNHHIFKTHAKQIHFKYNKMITENYKTTKSSVLQQEVNGLLKFSKSRRETA
jgi:hypothetical protein